MRRDRWWRTLQARLALGGLLWVCLGVSLSGAAIYELIVRHVTQHFRHEITDHLAELQGLYQSAGPGGELPRPVSDPRFGAPGSGYYWEIWRGGRPPLRSPSLEGRDMALPPGRRAEDRARIVGGPQRLVFDAWPGAASDPGGPALFAVGVDEAELDAVLAEFRMPLFGSLAAVAAGLCLAAMAQVAFGLRPLRRMRAALARVRTGEAEALPEDFPGEVQPLVSDLNEVLAANRDMLQRARAQAGNLAHALRTPLSILTAEAERLATEGHAEAAEAILQECRGMRRQIDHQIARARAAAHRTVAGPRVAVAPLAGEVLSAIARLHAGRGLAFANQVPAGLEAACDPDDLQEILANLLDNAAKWARGEVEVSARAAEGHAEILVEDDGPGVPEDQRQAVFGLGARLDERPAGAGLGLTIVRDLVDLYDGTVELGSSRLGGLKATVRLPL